MPLDPPQLDDRQFDDLFEEAKLRLRRYCPEWTDFNDSDPGIALVQLFAWLTELMLYRMNQIPEHHYISFLKLLKLERQAARPATTHVVMSMAASPTKSPIKSVRARSKFFATADSGQSLTFESLTPIDLVPYPLDCVQVFDGLDYEDYSKANDTGTATFRPLGWTPQLGNILYLGFHPDKAYLDKDFEATFPDKMVLRFFFPIQRQTSKSASGQSLPTLQWEYQSKGDKTAITFEADRWRPLTVIDDKTASLTREGDITLRGPGADCLATQSPKQIDDDRRYWIRCRFISGQYAKEDIPEIAFVRCNVVEVENRATVQNEVVGIGDGNTREFTFQNVPVDPKSVELVLVHENGVEERCDLKEDLFKSKSGDLSFTLNPNSGVIQFGDGKNGRIPDAGASLIAKSYRAGGNAEGNVRADAIKDPPLGVSGLDSVTNPRPAVGGTREETLDDLIKRAPRILRGDARAVTKDDYKRFTEEIPGVGLAIVRPKTLPEYPGLEIPGAITVVVIPESPVRGAVGQSGPPRYTPSPELLTAVRNRLEEIKPAGTELAVTPPRPHLLELSVTITPQPWISDDQAKEQIKKVLEHYFQPVEDKSDLPEIDPATHQRRKPPMPRWDVGSPLYPSRLYEVLFAATETDSDRRIVEGVADLMLKNSGTEIKPGDVLTLDPDELPDVAVTVKTTPPTGRRNS